MKKHNDTMLVDLDAVHYENHSTSQYLQAKELFKLININKHSFILDVGCGHGSIIAELSKEAPYGKCIGIDPSQSMISLASSKFMNASYPNLHFIQTAAEHMSFPEQSFNLIICTNALMWIKKPKAVLEYMCSLLKPEGEIVIFTYPNTTPYAKLFEVVLKEFLPDLVSKSAIKHMLSPEKHRNTLLKQGVKISLFALDNIIFSYENEIEFKSYVLGWLSCYAPIPNELQTQFLDKICERAKIEGYCDDTGRFAIPHQSLKIIAKKY